MENTSIAVLSTTEKSVTTFNWHYSLTVTSSSASIVIYKAAQMGHNWWVYKLIVNVSWSLTSFMAPVFIFGKYNLKPQLFEPLQTFNSPYNLKLVRHDAQPLSPSLTCPYFIWLCTMTTFILNCPTSSYYQQPVFICRQRVDWTILRSACIVFERYCALWTACHSLVKTGTKQDVASAGIKAEWGEVQDFVPVSAW